MAERISAASSETAELRIEPGNSPGLSRRAKHKGIE